MLIYSMGASVDGFIADRDGGIEWTTPSAELFHFHLERTRRLGAVLCGRRLYETMVVWETDAAVAQTPDEEEFARLWAALPKIVFSRTLERVEGNARLARGSLADEVAAARASTDTDVEVGGAGLAAEALALGLVDELRIFRYPVILGGGTPLLPPLDTGIRLELIETSTFPPQVIYERYARA